MFGQEKEFLLDASVLDSTEFLVSCQECGGRHLKSTKRGQIECLDCGAIFSFDKDDDSQRVLALFLYREGAQLLSNDNPGEERKGLNSLNQARRILQRLVAKENVEPYLHELDMDCLGAVYAMLADYYGYRTMDPSPAQRQKAYKYYQRSLDLAEQVLEQNESVEHLLNVSTMIQKLTLLDEELPDRKKSLEDALRAREMLLKAEKKAREEEPDMLGEIHRLLQGSYVLTAELYNFNTQIEKGKESYLGLVDLLQSMIEEGEDISNAKAGLLFAYARLAIICDQLGQDREVREYKQLTMDMADELEGQEGEEGSLMKALGINSDLDLSFLDQIGENDEEVMSNLFFNRMTKEGLLGDVDEFVDPLFAQDGLDELPGGEELRKILDRSIDREKGTLTLGEEFFEWLENHAPMLEEMEKEENFYSNGDFLFEDDDDYLEELKNDEDFENALEDLLDYVDQFRPEKFEGGKNLDQLQEYLIGLQFTAANVQLETGALEEGIVHIQRALKKLEDLYKKDHAARHLIGLTSYYAKMAMALEAMDKDEQSIKMYKKAFDYGEKALKALGRDENRFSLMDHLSHIGLTLAGDELVKDNPVKAMPYLKKTIDFCEKLDKADMPFDEMIYGAACYDYAKALELTENSKEAKKYFKLSKRYFDPRDLPGFKK